MNAEEKIIGFMQTEAYIPMRADELAVVLDVPHADLPLYHAIIDKLIAENTIVVNKKGRMKINRTEMRTGKFKATRSGGFVDGLNGEESVFIPLAYTNGAIDGDIVRFCIKNTKKKKPTDKAEGEITQILRHALTHVVGTLALYGRAAYVEPDNTALGFAVRVSDLNGAAAGDKVVARIEKYPNSAAYATGSITEILGKTGSIDAELSAISHKAGLRTAFDEETLAQAEQAQNQPVTPEGRTDFRQKCVITIDGDDSRDFDDAVCVEKGEGGYILYVHIADVTHYVTQGSPLDREAYKRGTSVYYPGRVLPMLPEALSNGICSLNEGEERYTLSVTMHINNAGAVSDYKIENGIIRSAHRMTYRVVTAILEDTDADAQAKYTDITPMLSDMRDLARILRKRRSARGSIDFNLPEPKIALGEDGFPTTIAAYEVGISNQIIEEFMLLANETVARFAVENNLPFVYRVHEDPSADKLEALNHFLGYMGLSAVRPKGKVTPQNFGAVLAQAQETDNPALVYTVLLRSMMKARYAEENLGHFGLAATHYCHFTSPIRRYPDLFIHRVLKAHINGELSDGYKAQLFALAKPAAENASETEIAAVEAEREADKYFMCLFMKQFVGCEFTAVISSITDFGMFVTVNDAIDGMVALSALSDDYYRYEPQQYCLRGERTGNCYALGDTLTVKLIYVSEHERKIDFAPVDAPVRAKKPHAKMLLEDKNRKTKSSKKKKGNTRKFVKKKR